jgi:hypothetical protein
VPLHLEEFWPAFYHNIHPMKNESCNLEKNIMIDKLQTLFEIIMNGVQLLQASQIALEEMFSPSAFYHPRSKCYELVN